MTETPDEIYTMLYCPACERPSFPGGGCIAIDHLQCPRCTTQLSAEHVHDYVSMDVAGEYVDE